MKSASQIWDEVPGLPKMLLMGGIFFRILVSVMHWFGSRDWWNSLTNTVATLGDVMLMPGLVLCAAALVAGGLAAIKKD